MSFPKYPAYRDSGVEWLGEVPEHWQVTRLKFIANVQTGVAKGKDNEGKETIEVPYLRVANVQDGYLSLDDVATIEIPFEDLPRYSLRPGDVLMNEGGDFDKLGRGHVWEGEIEPCIHQNHVFAIRPTKIPSYWLNAFAGSQPAQFFFMGRSKQSTNLASISSSNLMELPVAVPPDGELAGILAHLDHETARIDALIEEQQRLIELLKEKRQAVISHAVTKGLDPSVPMKDSGVEWLGAVPAHWEVTRIGWQCLIGNGCTPSRDNQNYWSDGHFPWLNSSKVNLGRVIDSDQFVTESALRECALPIVKPGSVLMAITGEGKTRGMVTITEIDATISQHIAFMKPRGGALISGYLHDWLSANYERLRHNSADWGSTKAAITCSDIRAYPLPLPPIDEQKKICQFIEEKSSHFDELTLAADENVNLLQERRSALISAAVTGKIDLRGWQPPAGTPAPLREQETA